MKFALIVLAWGMVCTSAYAQTSTYSNTNTLGNGIDDTTTCGVAALIRTFVVPASDDFTVGDLDVGFLATHTYRGDIRVDLTAPDPLSTTVRIIESNTGAGGFANYNVELDDENTTVLNVAPHNNGDGTVAPPYENQIEPSNPLAAFNGLNSVGTWTMTICDDFNGFDDGAFLRSDLFFTHLIPNADLSMSIGASSNTPNIGNNVVLTYTISNAGPLDADSVTADIQLPSGLSYVSDNGGSSFNSATGLWTIPTSIAATGNESLQIVAFVENSGAYNTTAEVLSSDVADIDSTPGNGITSEDDFDSLTLVPTTPPLPPLLCPGAASVLDWDTAVWPEGSLGQSFTIDGENITMSFSNSGVVYQNDPTFGGQSPAEQTVATGGFAIPESNIAVFVNQVSQSNIIDMDISIGTAGTGVSKLQMTLFDVDIGAGQFEDQITVIGRLGASTVTPTLTTGSANAETIPNSQVTGTGTAGDGSGAANVTIQFDSPVDTVEIDYGNGPGAPADPGGQAISVHDIFFCPPIIPAVLNATKTTAVYDPLSEGLYAIPGNDVIYTIEFTNTGDGDADLDSVMIIDSMPSEIEFYNGDIDDAGPQTNPVIGIDNGSGLNLDYATDVKISKATSKPTSFATCTNDPLVSGYDPDVTFICVNPSGTMVAGDPDPSFQIQFRARIK